MPNKEDELLQWNIRTTTDDTPIREPDQIREDCTRRLRAVQISDHV